MPIPDPSLVFAYLCARLGIDPDDDRGMTTTEVAVVTFLLVGAALVVRGIIYASARATPRTSPTRSNRAADRRLMARRRTRGDEGMTAIQVAILFPAILFWLMLIVQYGLWWHAKQVANAA